MFAGVKNGAGLMNASLRAFAKHPSLIVPLLFCWLVYAPVIVHLKFFFPWDKYSTVQQFIAGFLVIFLFSYIVSLTFLMLLELIRQIENGEREDPVVALAVALIFSFRALPITVAWAVMWFAISVVQAFFRRGDEDDDDADMEFNAENVARTVAGFEQIPLSRAFLEVLKKGVRMAAFLIYPAIAWEDMTISQAFKKGLGVGKSHAAEFATGFILTELAAAAVFLPPFIMFILSSKFDVTFPDWVWISTLIYVGFAWSFSLLLEQLFTAELYLWHMLWEKDCVSAQAEGREKPSLGDTRRPSILDNVPDLNNVL